DFTMLLNQPEDDVDDVSTTLTMNTQQQDPAPTFTHNQGNAYLSASTGTLSDDEQPGTWTITRTKGVSPSQGDLDYPDGWLDRTRVVGLLMVVRYVLVPSA